MAYVELGQFTRSPRRPLSPKFRKLPRPGGPVPQPGFWRPSQQRIPQIQRLIEERAKRLPPGAEITLTPAERGAVTKAIRAGGLPAFRQYISRSDLAGDELGKFKLKKIFKPIGKILKPIVKMVKPFLAPLVAMIPGVGPVAAVAVKAAQAIRASAKAQQAQQAVAAAVQQAPSWGTMTPAQQQAVIGAIQAGQIPSVQVPPDVSAAYQQAIQQQAAALPPPPAGPGAPSPFPEYAPGAAAAAPMEAGIMGGGMGTMLALGAAGLIVTMAMGGGRRRG